MKNCTTYFLLILIFLSCNKTTEKVLIHECGETSSSYNLIKWNISDKDNRLALRETVDRKGRVIKLEYLVNYNGGYLCYLPDVVEYEYEKNKIIEKLFKNGNEMEATECEMPYKTIYFLNKNYIEKVENFFKFDTINFSKKEITEIKKYIPEHRILICNDTTNSEVEFYYHSYAKMNGIYPTNKNYKYDPSNYYYGDEPEAESIVNGIKKLTPTTYNRNYGGFDYVRIHLELLKLVLKPKINAYQPSTDGYTIPLPTI
jgi:hypothetical protein